MRRYWIASVAGVLVLGLGLARVQSAEATSKPAGLPGLRAGLFEKLNLTDDQKAKVKEILQAARADAEKAEGREAKAKVLKDALEKIKTDVLTEEQRKQLEELRGKVAEGLKGLGAKVFEKLGLTDEQKAKVKEILQAARADAEKADGKEAKAKALKDALEKIRTDVLTEDQRKQLDEMKGKLGGLREKVKERRAGARGDAQN